MVEWARQNDRGDPKSVDQLQDTEFAEQLAAIAEEAHLDKVVNSAFVNTEEAKADGSVRQLDNKIY